MISGEFGTSAAGDGHHRLAVELRTQRPDPVRRRIPVGDAGTQSVDPEQRVALPPRSSPQHFRTALPSGPGTQRFPVTTVPS